MRETRHRDSDPFILTTNHYTSCLSLYSTKCIPNQCRERFWDKQDCMLLKGSMGLINPGSCEWISLLATTQGHNLAAHDKTVGENDTPALGARAVVWKFSAEPSYWLYSALSIVCSPQSCVISSKLRTTWLMQFLLLGRGTKALEILLQYCWTPCLKGNKRQVKPCDTSLSLSVLKCPFYCHWFYTTV